MNQTVKDLPLLHLGNMEYDLRSLMKDDLLSHGISYFNYLRVQSNGQYCLLSSHSEVIKYLFENTIPVAAPVAEETVSHKFNYLVLPEKSYEKALDDFQNRFNLGNFIDLVECEKNCIELFCFGSAANNPQIINFYLNRIDILEKFKSLFKEKTQGLIKRQMKTELILPQQMMPEYINIINAKYALDGANLTLREVQCLRLLQQGKTAKQTAKILHLSSRTVESYLENIKSKLNATNRVDLLNKLTHRII